MITFIARRLVVAFFVVLASSFFVYVMMANAGDPLAFIIEIQDDYQRRQVERMVTESLNLDTPIVGRYFLWLGDLVLQGDFGISARTQLPVWDELSFRIPMTLKLVGFATVLSMAIGIVIGVVTALRQYSGFDYLTSFFTFLFFSLPVFWVGIILKGVGGINFNDWLRDSAQFSPLFLVLAGLFAAIVCYSSAGGTLARKLAVTAIGVGIAEALLLYVSITRWLRNPGFAPGVIAVIAFGIAAAVVAVLAGWRNTKARNSALTTAAIGVALWFPLQSWLDDVSVWEIIGLGFVAIAVGMVVGYTYGGFDRGQSARVSAITALLMSVVVFANRAMQSWDDYSESSIIRNRPIKTIGDRESRIEGDFWLVANDTFSHLLLPTLALMLISLATYTRYSRGSMLEVLNQDYIRTARSKGLTERTVIVRHGFRNAMIPLATVVAFDFGGMLGGAVITETVFEWNAMGKMFIEGLRNLDPNPVMAFFVVVGGLAVIFNLLADIAYSVLDPRIRLTGGGANP